MWSSYYHNNGMYAAVDDEKNANEIIELILPEVYKQIGYFCAILISIFLLIWLCCCCILCTAGFYRSAISIGRPSGMAIQPQQQLQNLNDEQTVPNDQRSRYYEDIEMQTFHTASS